MKRSFAVAPSPPLLGSQIPGNATHLLVLTGNETEGLHYEIRVATHLII